MYVIPANTADKRIGWKVIHVGHPFINISANEDNIVDPTAIIKPQITSIRLIVPNELLISKALFVKMFFTRYTNAAAIVVCKIGSNCSHVGQPVCKTGTSEANIVEITRINNPLPTSSQFKLENGFDIIIDF